MSLKTHFNLAPADYEAMRTGHMGRRRHETIRRELAGRGERVRTVVELGSGTGRLLADLAADFPGTEFVGLDIESTMVEYAQGRYRLPNVRYAQSDVVSDGGLPRAEFVYSIDVLHHVHEPLPFFEAVRGMLEPGGVWLAIEPNIFHPYIFWLQERMRRNGFDEDHFRPWASEPLLREAGFRVESRSYRYALPGWIQSAPPIVGRLERVVERAPVLGGSVVYLLVAE
jgi:SAM-dependent methyltransferase